MWLLGQDNWIQYGWGPGLEKEWSPKAKLHIDYSRVNQHETMDPLIASIYAVKDIQASHKGPYTLMCSGGVDSQVMLWAWKLSGVPFTVLSVRYVSNGTFFNAYDIVDLQKFCNEHDIEISFIDFDVINFLETDLQFFSRTYDCDSPQICTHMKMTEVIESGTILFGGNYLTNNGAMLSYTLLGLHRYAETLKSKSIIPFFLAHNPTLAKSFPSFPSTQLTKNEVYKKAGFPIIAPPEKWNGFEKLKEFYDDKRTLVPPFDRLRWASKPSNRPFDLLFRYPLHQSGKSDAGTINIF